MCSKMCQYHAMSWRTVGHPTSNEQPLQRSKVPCEITSILTTHCICTEAGTDSKRNQLAENIHLVSRSSCHTAQRLRDFYVKMLQATTASKKMWRCCILCTLCVAMIIVIPDLTQ